MLNIWRDITMSENEIKKNEYPKRKLFDILNMLAIIITVLTIFVAIFVLFNSTLSAIKDVTNQINTIKVQHHEKYTYLDNRIKEIGDSLSNLVELKQRLRLDKDSIYQNVKSGTTIKKLENKIKIFEDVLLDNPNKALSLPLLRKELDYLNSTIKYYHNENRREVDRIYNQTKWLIGIMFGFCTGLIILAFSNILLKDKKESSTKNVQ